MGYVPPVAILPSQLLCHVFLKRACQGSLVLVHTLSPPWTLPSHPQTGKPQAILKSQKMKVEWDVEGHLD